MKNWKRDRLLGAVLFKLRDKSRAELKAISTSELAGIVDFANAAGSLTTTKGARFPLCPACRKLRPAVNMNNYESR
jgi:fructokinase